MKRPMLILLVFAIPVFVYWFNVHQSAQPQQAQQTALDRVGNECAGIADNAVANMQAIVEFQKLEIEGRKFNVIRRCMADHNYMENPSWLTYAHPIAKSDALKLNISEDEALENLRRKHMLIFNQHANQHANQPIYWVHRP